MRTRWILAASLAAVVLIPTPALAWANGPNGCNSFGAHDWVLREALNVVSASWVRPRVALRATDDPDCKDGIDHASSPWWHVYDLWGETYGDAPEATTVWARRVERRLAEGNHRGASRALGIMSHFVADVANPMHTDQRPREERIHSSYEDAVDRRLDRYSFGYDGPSTSRPGRRTVLVAEAAHEHYFRLVRAYDRNGYSRRVHRITKRQLNRAANAVADLINGLH